MPGSGDRGSWTRQLNLAILVFAIGGSAFAFGSVELWAQEWLRFTGLLALVLVLWRIPAVEFLGGGSGRLALPAVALIAWAIVQALPLPAGVVAAVSPKAAETHRVTVPAEGVSLPEWLVARARDEGISVASPQGLPPSPSPPGDVGIGRSLSLHPHATRMAALSWTTPVLFFLVGAWVARSEVARYRLMWGVAWWTGLLGLIAIAQRLTWNGKILWLRPAPDYIKPLGPFVNPTHFAGFVEMGTLVALGLGLAVISRTSGRLDLAALKSTALDREWGLPRLLASGSLVLLGACGLVLSRSEGGALAFGAGLSFLVLARLKRGAAVILVPTVVIAGLAVGLTRTVWPSVPWLETDPLMSSQLSPSFALRADAWSRTVDVFSDFPVAGTGLATFPWAFPRYRRSGEWATLEETHNDYLQLVSETGVVGILLLAWCVWAFTRRVFSPALDHARRRKQWTTRATAAAVFAMLVHSIGDFNLQTPANAVLFATLLGMLTASAEEPASDPESP